LNAGGFRVSGTVLVMTETAAFADGRVIVEAAVGAVQGGDFKGFRAFMVQLADLGYASTRPLVEEVLHEVLLSEFGSAPSLDSLSRASRSISGMLSPHMDVLPLQLELIMRRFYGEPDLVTMLVMPLGVMQGYELALTAVLRSVHERSPRRFMV
jgi:hypothetical protein